MTRPDEERFERHGELGRGATASVYLAHDHERGHVVALKVLHAHLVGDPSARRRLEREVRTSALVQHEAALVPYELHELADGTALSMPFHPGETLAGRISAKGPLSPAEVRELGRRLAGGLVAAHRAGVLHRDLSPNNVLLTEASDAVLTDFGLARVGGGHTATATGMLGTVGYAAPELLDGERGDPRSDLYALGAVLYLAVTGVAPFPGGSAVAALKAQLDGSLRPVRELAPSCPRDLARTIEALLESDPDRRPQGAPDVLDLLEGRIPSGAPPRRTEAVKVAQKGRWWVEVRERASDVERRHKLRQAAKQSPAERRWSEVGEAIGRSIESGLRSLVGLDPATVPAEEQLVAEVEAMGFEVDRPRVLESSFTLVRDVDEATARHLAERATALGFDAAVRDVPDLRAVRGWTESSWIWVVAALLYVLTDVDVLAFAVAFVLTPAALVFRTEQHRRMASEARDRPVAHASEGTPAEPTSVPTDVGDRAAAALDALGEALERADLPDVARADLVRTHDELRTHAAAAAHTLRGPVHAPSGLDADVAHLERRRTRLVALSRAGQGSADELAQVEQALDARREALLAADRAEGERIAAMAQLVEIASTADRVRYELAAGPDGDAREATERLRREAAALRAARRELSRQGAS